MGRPPPGDEAGNHGVTTPNANGGSPNSSSPKQIGFNPGSPSTPASRSSNLIALEQSKASVAYPDLGDVTDLKNSRSSRSAATQNKLANNSIFARIAYHHVFQNLTLAVVVINAIWIGIDTEWNHKNKADDDGKTPLQPASDIVEHCFCGYFTFDVVVRFLAFRNKCYFWKDGWFVFDFILVAFMVIETWVLLIVQEVVGGGDGADFMGNFSVLRLLRLARLTRMARLMRQVPELVTLCKGVISATKAVCWILGFLVAVMYVFGIIMCGFIENSDEEDSAGQLFGTLGDAMMSLFTLGVLGDNMFACWESLIFWHDNQFDSYAMQWLYFIFFCISSLTLLNMLIGVLCEVITQTSDSETNGRMENELRWCIEDAFDNMDLNQDSLICEDEWAKIKTNPSLRNTLENLGVDEDYHDVRLDQMQEILFHPKFGTIVQVRTHDNEKGIKMEQLINKVVEIRPDKEASALDVEMLRSIIKIQDKRNQKRLKAVQESVAQICRVRGVDPTLTPRATEMPRQSGWDHRGSEMHQRGNVSVMGGIAEMPGEPSKPGTPVQQREAHLSPNRPTTPSKSAGHGGKWAHPTENRTGSKNKQKQINVEAEPTLTSIMPVTPTVTPASSDLLKVLNEPPTPQGDPTLLVRPATSGSNPNLRDVPMEQLIVALKRRDPTLLKGLPLIGVGDSPSSASQRNEKWAAQQCPELHVEPASRSLDLT